jgi:hypothetical protein
MKDESALLALLERTSSLQSLADAGKPAATSMTGRLSAIHATQVEVITRLLREGAVPASLIRMAPSPTVTASPAGEPSAAALAVAEQDSVSQHLLAGASRTHVALIGSMLAQRLAAAKMLGGPDATMLRPKLTRAEAVRLLAAFRSTVYGFEIVAAQIDSGGRPPALSTLAWLGRQASELRTLVGPTGAPSPLGYELPFAVTNRDSARRLAQHLIKALLAALAAALEPATGDSAALTTVVRWLGTTAAIASGWDVPLSAFPGLTNA